MPGHGTHVVAQSATLEDIVDGHPADKIAYVITLAVLARDWSERLAEATTQGFTYTLTLQLSASIMLPEGGDSWVITFGLRRITE